MQVPMYPYSAYYQPQYYYHSHHAHYTQPQTLWHHPRYYNYPTEHNSNNLYTTPTDEQVYAAKSLKTLQLKRKLDTLSASKVETIHIEPSTQDEPREEKKVKLSSGEFNDVVKMFDLPSYDTIELDKQPKTKLFVTVPKVESMCSDGFNVVDVPSDADTSKLHRVMLSSSEAIQSMIALYGKSTSYMIKKLDYYDDKLSFNVSVNNSHARARLCLTGRGCIKLCQQVVCPDNIEQVKQVLAIVPSLVYAFEPVSQVDTEVEI